MKYSPLKVLSVAALVVIATGCASNSKLDEVSAMAAAAQQTANEANQTANAAKSAADRAQSTADQALATANAANMTAEEANEKIDRAFKRSMEK